MKNTPLWRIQLSTLPEAESAIGGLVERIAGQKPVSFRKEGGKTVQLSVHGDERFSWTAESRRTWQAGLAILKACGLQPGPCRWVVSKVKKEDWAESWKKHFPPLAIGCRLLVKPSWSRRKAGKGMAEVVLDPGLSFGTGQHPTTAFCLEQLVACATAPNAGAFLDIGTGSGILAIAAAKLGYRPVKAFDFDADCVKVSLDNAKRNGVEALVKFSRQDLTRLKAAVRPQFDVVCSNLEFPLLIAESDKISSRLRAGGTLILAGILRRQFPAIRKHYAALGCKLVADHAAGEWHSGAFEKIQKTSP
jgi:ribosomal protein L11 methyltransferase